MEAYQIDTSFKTYTLSSDEPIMGYTKRNLEINFKAGDQIIVSTFGTLRSGSLVLIDCGGQISLRRFEKISGIESVFPPVQNQSHIILGEVVDHVRLSKWFSVN